jgi:hypothetical protein
MSKFFQVEKAAYAGQKNSFKNIKFKKHDLDNSVAAETGTILEIIPIHIKNPPVIQFIAYLTRLGDNINSSQTKTQPYGRPDPYYIWQSTHRQIAVSFDIPSSSVTAALDNLNNLSWFLASLYPAYKDTQTATSIAASPLFRVRFANLICSSTKGGQGLLGVIEGARVIPDIKTGFIGINPQNMGSSGANIEAKLLKEAGFHNSISDNQKFLVPKLMKISFQLKVVHDHALGWDSNTGNWRGGRTGPGFPYNFGLRRDTTETPSAGTTVFDDTQVGNTGNPSDLQSLLTENAEDQINATGGPEVQIEDAGGSQPGFKKKNNEGTG